MTLPRRSCASPGQVSGGSRTSTASEQPPRHDSSHAWSKIFLSVHEWISSALDSFEEESQDSLSRTTSSASQNEDSYSSEEQQDNIRRRSRLPRKAKQVLETWFRDNINEPYPSKSKQLKFKTTLNITMNQIRNWFTNRRKKEKRTRMSKELEEDDSSPKSSGKASSRKRKHVTRSNGARCTRAAAKRNKQNKTSSSSSSSTTSTKNEKKR